VEELPESESLVVTAQVVPERRREREFENILNKLPAFPESDKEKHYIIRLFSSKLVLLKEAHQKATSTYYSIYGREMPENAMIIVTRPDIHVDQIHTGFLETMRASLRESPEKIFTQYVSMWVSNDQFFVTSRLVLEKILSIDYACLTGNTFMSSMSLFGTGFTRNLTLPHVKWGRDWFYAEVNLIMLFELLIGTSNVVVTEGGFEAFDIARDCPNFGSTEASLKRTFPADWVPSGDSVEGALNPSEMALKWVAGGSERSLNGLNWTDLALAKSACGGSSPSCPKPYEKGRYPFVPKKIMRMYLQNRNDTFVDWENTERKRLLKKCVL